jgi:hypothetical protein
MRIRIVTFGLNIPAEDYAAHAHHIAAEFTTWPGLLAKWWLSDPASGTYGGVYLFASRHDADLSREIDLFQEMLANPALDGVEVEEYEVLGAPTAVTTPVVGTRSITWDGKASPSTSDRSSRPEPVLSPDFDDPS